MIDGGIYFWMLPIFRTIIGFCIGGFLAIMGGWMARNFNQLVGYAWDGNVHLNIYLVGIGLGAGLGAYVAWMNLTSRWYLLGASGLLAVLGRIVGTYLGAEYGQNIEATYMGQRATIVNNSHWGAAIGGIAVATCLGVFNEIRTKGR